MAENDIKVGVTPSFIEDANGKNVARVSLAGGTGGSSSTPTFSSITTVTGAASVAVAQLTTSTTAAILVVARATRRSVTIRNHDTTISVYVGPATVTAGNGLLLKAGESINVSWVGLIQVIAASGTPIVGYWDEFD